MKLVLLDEVNCALEGLPQRHINYIIEKTEISVPGAFQTAAFKTGNWNGKESFFSEDGLFFQYMIPQVVDLLEVLGYDVDEFDIEDEREEIHLPAIDHVDDTFLIEETGRTLRQHQVDGINTAIERKQGTLEFATNSGKAQPLYSKVLTPNGWKTIGSIVVGDSVIGSDGQAKSVTGVFPQGKKPIYEVLTSRGSKTRCCDEHLWAVRDKYAASRGSAYKIKSLAELMGSPLSTTQGNKWQIPVVSPVEFDMGVGLKIDPYVLGVFLGDGTTTNAAVSITNPEKDILSIVSAYLPEGDVLVKTKDRARCDSYRIVKERTVHHERTKTAYALESYGLLNTRSNTKFIPSEYLYASLDDRVKLLRGLIDTDGYTYSNNSIEYTTVSYQMANDIRHLVLSLGGQCSIGTKEAPQYEYLGEKRTGQTAYRLYIKFGKDGIVPVSSKKHLLKYNPKRRVSDSISNISYVGEEECVCIAIDSNDHLYVTDDFILTHNTNLALGISKVFDPYMKSIVIVPSETLVKQTYEDYANSHLSCVALTPKIKPNKRQETIDNHRHIIVTAKLLLNCLELLNGEPYVLIVDEIHSYFGDRFSEALRFELANCPVRIGLTGTYPKDKYKREKIACHMGGGVLDKVSNDYLIQNKYSSTVDIRMISTRHPELEEMSEESEEWTWDTESTYLRTHIGRIGAIADYIKTLEPTNTLVLCHPQLGLKLSTHFNDKMITDDTPTAQRQEWFAEFENSEEPVFLCASFGTGATGISQNRIFRLILIDVGKNPTYIKQSIGRGLRLDGDVNHIDVIDISAMTKYSKKHKKERIKVYKQEKFCYTEEDNEITVED